MAWGERIDDHPVDFRGLQADLEGLVVALRRGVAQNIDGIAVAPMGREKFTEFGDSLRAQFPRLFIPFAEGIHGHDAGTAGIGDDGHVAAQGAARLAQGLSATEELGDGVHPDHPGPPEQGIIGIILTRQGPGVGGGGLGRGLGAPGLGHDDGLDPGNRAGGTHKLPVVGDIFHIDDDALGPFIVAQVIDHIPKIEISHGADTDKVAEADLFSRSPIQGGTADGAALGQEGQITGPGRVRRKTGIELGVGADDAHTIGSQIPDVGFPGGSLDLGFDLLAGFPHLFAAGGNDDGPGNAGLDRTPG